MSGWEDERTGGVEQWGVKLGDKPYLCDMKAAFRKHFHGIRTTFSFHLLLLFFHQDVQTSVDQYATLFTGARTKIGSISSAGSIESRQQNYKTLVGNFYDLATDFYEYGWGQVRRE